MYKVFVREGNIFNNFIDINEINLHNVNTFELENRINELLKDMGKFYYMTMPYGYEYIDFHDEEDAINFILKYSL